MTQATESTAAATLSGRELALNRRKAMALHGKAAAKKKNTAAQVRASERSMAAPVATRSAGSMQSASAKASVAAPQLSATIEASGRSASRARREAMSHAGKSAIKPTAGRPSGRVRPTRQQAAYAGSAATSLLVEASSKSCGCGCNGAEGGCGGSQVRSAADYTQVAAVESGAGVSIATEIKPSSGAKLTGRALARARRTALAQDGKSGLKRVAQATKIATAMPDQDWQVAMTKGATGRQKAMQRRIVQSLAGSTKKASANATRPAGRMRARLNVPAPAKVEEGHTLAGREVTGTQVERTLKVTGNEPGSCRNITGTEYIGAEQFDKLCDTRPPAAPSKIGVSHTAREHKVTGTEVGRSVKVTGDELGACRGITGTEYLAVERYNEFCDSRPAQGPLKVGMAETGKGKPVTGTQVSRSEKVTGNEPGSGRSITGTGYALPANGSAAPEKVVLTHTSQGKPVTGTAVGHTAKLTGDEPGSCRAITGTEYLAQEQYVSQCATPAPQTPRKVSVMSSRANQPVSGTEVGRSAKVTGDEPGSCRSITGSQYYTPSSFGALCDSAAPKKVATMQTLAGRSLTGTEVGRSPKVTGDEMGGCMPVTGIDYIGADQQQAVCGASTPVKPIAKVAVDQTWRGQPITGAYVGRATRVTGNESGGCAPISGTPYIGRGQYNNFCESPTLQAQEARIRSSAVIPSIAVTGDRPGAGGSVMTGDERGACEPVSGTPYVGVDNTTNQCAASGRFVPRATWQEPPRAPAPMDFSITTPARAASQRRYEEVTGTGYSSERITGPVNKAAGLITGTPEFRHRGAASAQVVQEEVVSAARRLTGEGSQSGREITGDAWSALSRVTGTEGASSLARNPSSRGNPRGMGANALSFRDIELPEVPASRITGSSGNSGVGALVTLSGGARG